MLARVEAGGRLRGVHLRGRAKNHCVQLFQCQAVGEIGGDVTDAVLAGDLFRFVEIAADQRDHFHAVDQLDRVKMLDAEGAGACQCDFDGLAHCLFSRIRWPTAVFDAGT
jgi:hypothetical protein